VSVDLEIRNGDHVTSQAVRSRELHFSIVTDFSRSVLAVWELCYDKPGTYFNIESSSTMLKLC